VDDRPDHLDEAVGVKRRARARPPRAVPAIPSDAGTTSAIATQPRIRWARMASSSGLVA
jgi:hypothetical protein